MNKTLLATALIAAMGLTACGSDDSSSSKSSNTSTPKPNTGSEQKPNPAAINTKLFTVRGDWAIMHGEITSKIVSELNALVAAHPEVTTLVMQDVPGSNDDEENLKAGIRLRELGLNTYLPPGGEIASGGVDLFLAGKERFAAPDVLVGVHSWGGNGITDASTLGRGHEAHQPYLDYYTKLGINTDFYWFTIQAATADSIHWMNVAERQQYGITTREATEKELNMITAHASKDAAIQSLFNQYTWVQASNNKPIHIFAANDVSPLQIAKARSVMQHYLREQDGLTSKKTMSAKLGDNQASLFMFADEAASERAFEGSLGSSPLAQHGQDLYASEVFVEGGNRYTNRTTVDGRDATYEEVLHLVQGHGLAPAEKALQQRIVTIANQALMDKIWNPISQDVTEWQSETDANGYTSVNYEYLAAAVEGYYGIWGHRDSGLDGYQGNTRAAQKTSDPNGHAIIEEIWPSHISSVMAISPDWPADQTFSLHYQADTPYTHQSQYLTHVRLTGSNNSHLLGNDANNRLQGNQGNNRIDGGAGDQDYAIFKGLSREYTIALRDGVWHVTDQVVDRDGTDQLSNVEWLLFSDGELELATLLD